jgi:DNA repair protein RadA/Sms
LLTIDEISPSLLIIDSIQMLFSNDCDGALGGEKQLLHCTSSILNKAKNSSKSMCVFFVGQVTKDDELRGSREFEHMVDAVFTLSIGDESGILRMFKSTKNRFGDTSEVGLFEMQESGLKALTNPNKYFITERTTPVCGSAISAIKEGSRTIAIEINALAETNNFTYPSRISQGINKDFLQILLAVMENKMSSNTKKKDIYVQTSNGIRVKDTYIGLGIIAAIDSSISKIPISNDIAFVGEVSLTGEIKKVPNLDRIISDFERMGFKEIVVPANNTTKSFSKIVVKELKNIKDLKTIIK